MRPDERARGGLREATDGRGGRRSPPSPRTVRSRRCPRRVAAGATPVEVLYLLDRTMPRVDRGPGDPHWTLAPCDPDEHARADASIH
eukprot:scaffold6937_cov376-Prasinococcus_capsulatus_cf.AAC.2